MAQEWGLVAILAAFGLLVMGMTWSGCTPYKTAIRDHFTIKSEPSSGHCPEWFEIEEEVRGEILCNERRGINSYHVFCTRMLGHRGGHHMHGAGDNCYWIW